MAYINSLTKPEKTLQSSKANSINLIYAGGTFGSFGKPLNTLPADVFVPILSEVIAQNAVKNIRSLPNSCVKDSSQLTPSDFAHFYELIVSHYSASSRQFLLITGTDTLSYLGAFLAEAFAGSDICIVLTASMKPLLEAYDISQFSIDEQSDAWGNLNDAIGLSLHGESGVHITFAGESWPAQTVQKIHSHDLMAFTGHHRAGYPANSYVKSLPPARRANWIEDSHAKLPSILDKAGKVVIPTLFCVPNSPSWIENQLNNLGDLDPTGVILLGFGAGNLPYSKGIARAMDDLYHQGHMLVCTTQCPYGGVSGAYAAGSWQYKHHVISAGRLTNSAIYARLLWLHLAFETPSRRRQRWTNNMSKTDIGLIK